MRVLLLYSCMFSDYHLLDPGEPGPHGKEVLPDLVRSLGAEYEALSAQERKQLVRELDNFKANKAKAKRISSKSRINDVTHTLATVESEVSL